MNRIVNRVPTLRKPSGDGTDRLLADIKHWGGFDRWLNMMITLYGDAALDRTKKVYRIAGYHPLGEEMT